MARLRSGMLLLLLLLVIVGCCSCLDRKLDYAFNENCKELCINANVRFGHVRAAGPNDTVHYIWDFTNKPTIFIAVTSRTAKLNVDWSKYIARLPHAVQFTEKPIYTFGVVIERILEFDDIDDNARINDIPDENIVEVDFKNFQWHHKNLTQHDGYVDFYVQASNYRDSKTNETRGGHISFFLQGFSNANHFPVIPRMLHSENSTQVDIVIDHLDTKANFNRSRFAFELLFVSENDANSTLTMDELKKLDDEFAPGVFEIVELLTPDTPNKSGYLQWRPVSYKSPNRDTVNSTSTIIYPLQHASLDEYFSKENFLYLYYGQDKMLDNLAQRVDISIGEKGDGFYNKTKYYTWTFVAGYGKPPVENFSFFVFLIVAIGVGVPVLVLIIASVYKIIRSRRQRDNELMIR